MTNNSPIPIFEQELPTQDEFENGIDNLLRFGNKVDFILTHMCPINISKLFGFNVYDEEKSFLEFMDNIYLNVNFKDWFFGHYHLDFSYGKMHCLFNKVHIL